MHDRREETFHHNIPHSVIPALEERIPPVGRNDNWRFCVMSVGSGTGGCAACPHPINTQRTVIPDARMLRSGHVPDAPFTRSAQVRPQEESFHHVQKKSLSPHPSSPAFRRRKKKIDRQRRYFKTPCPTGQGVKVLNYQIASLIKVSILKATNREPASPVVVAHGGIVTAEVEAPCADTIDGTAPVVAA